MSEITSDQALYAALGRVLGVPEGQAAFRKRPDQLSIIRDILRGRDVLAVTPTGGGKSVCYQVPALCLPGLTLVVSPLAALIQDQGQALFNNGIPAACLTGDFLLDRDGAHVYSGEDGAGSRSRRDRLFYDAAEGRYKLLYVTPERLRTGAFIRFVQNTDISLIAVDEAHCVSLWGYDFRPRYLEITRLIRRLDRRPPVAAFTATATVPVLEDIRCFLDMRFPREYIYPAVRDDLRFFVRRFASTSQRLAFLIRFIHDRPGVAGIVYCATASGVDTVFAALRSSGIDALRFYAKLDEGGASVPLSPGESRKANLETFLRGGAPVMVSTTALGMGIDLDCVRYVLHCALPLSLEDYFQEAGRAGRDGGGGECVLCHVPEDEQVSRTLLESTLRSSGLEGADLAARRRTAEEQLYVMMKYCALPDGALAGFIRSYFQDPLPPALESEAQKVRLAMAKRVKGLDAVYANRTKIAGELRQGRMAGRDLSVGRTRPGAAAQAVSYNVEGPALTYFDLMVADAVYTLMKNRVKTVTARGVMELLSGDPDLTLRPERRAAVEASIRKMMVSTIKIDRSGSLGCGFVYSRQGDKARLSGPFLPLFEKNSGFGYEAGTLPPLYEYAEIMNGQFYVLPTQRLRVPGLPTNEENLALTWYLLLRVGSMGRGPRYAASTSRYIRADTMVKVMGISLPEGNYERKRKLAALADKERRILEHLRSLGYIRGFTIEPEAGRALIELRADKEEENP